MCAQKAGYKESVTVYKQWGVKKKGGQGKKPVIWLRFSKTRDEDVECWYSTHFVDKSRIEYLKQIKIVPKAEKTGEEFSENNDPPKKG